MFISCKEIKNQSTLISNYQNKTNTYTYLIKDSDFILKQSITSNGPCLFNTIKSAAAVVFLYEKQNLDIISNLYLLNKFLELEYGFSNLLGIVKTQANIDRFFDGLNFKEKYYNDLFKYTKKMLVLE